jgi:hypothetical protein
MRWLIVILLAASIAVGQTAPNTPRSRTPQRTPAAKPAAKVFLATLSKVKASSHVVILLPSELPQPIAGAKHAAVEAASKNEYAISLYYELGVGDSGFAASFGAKAYPRYRPDELPNLHRVQLAHDIVGYFHPVSCGGSCAPANLWWEEDQVLYQIQLRLPSTLPVRDQQNAIVTTANSAILAGPR